jgi:signal transduction histidine kinase
MPRENQQTVLTVDDNDVLRYSIGRVLRDAGYRVVEARTGREALELAATSPDLITLDINLPDLDGFQVCKELKANPETGHIPVVHVSATLVEPQHRVQGLKGGADAYLTEPVDRAELVATIEALLRSRRSEKEARQSAKAAESARRKINRRNFELEARVKQRTAELEQKSNEIRRLNSHLLRIQDDERRRIARELHDSVGQLLALLNLNLTRLRDLPEVCELNGTVQAVEECSALASEITGQVRTVSYLLHPPLLDKTGLEPALKWFAQGFEERSRIAVTLNVAPSFGRLPADVEIALFRVVQESLTNVNRHSNSKTAIITLCRDENEAALTVQDTGTKFAKGLIGLAPGVGILGMRERIRQLGGELNVYFEPTGVCVKAAVPVTAAVAIEEERR